MARILFVTWYGGGNQAPAAGLAQELRPRGHEVTFAGYEVQRERFEALGIPFTVLARSSEAYRSHGGPFARVAVAADVLASADHLRDVPDIIARTQCDGLVVDCLQFGALAAAEDTGLPVAVLVHSAPGVMVPPGGRLEGRLLAPVNALRATAGKPPVTRLWEAWPAFRPSARRWLSWTRRPSRCRRRSSMRARSSTVCPPRAGDLPGQRTILGRWCS